LQLAGITMLVAGWVVYVPAGAQEPAPQSDASAAATAPEESGQSAKKEFSVTEIYEATRAGHFEEAKNMISKVLQDHPRSSKAHYVAAQVYAKSGDLRIAKQELNRAEELRPGLPFANAKSLAELRRELANVKVSGDGAVTN
jgi:Flp pilus assembly protein TadD